MIQPVFRLLLWVFLIILGAGILTFIADLFRELLTLIHCRLDVKFELLDAETGRSLGLVFSWMEKSKDEQIVFVDVCITKKDLDRVGTGTLLCLQEKSGRVLGYYYCRDNQRLVVFTILSPLISAEALVLCQADNLDVIKAQFKGQKSDDKI